MKETDINLCVRRTAAPDAFRQAMSQGQVPDFGKKKSYLSKPKTKKKAAQ